MQFQGRFQTTGDGTRTENRVLVICLKLFLKNIFSIKTVAFGPREAAPQLRTDIASPDDPSLVLSTQIKWFINYL